MRRPNDPSGPGNGFPRKAHTLRVDVTAFHFATATGDQIYQDHYFKVACGLTADSPAFHIFILLECDGNFVKSFVTLSPKYVFATYLCVVNP